MAIVRIIAALLVAATRGGLASTLSMDEGGTQFIYYNGSLAGSFVSNIKFKYQEGKVYQNCIKYTSYYVENDLQSSLYIGKDPQWDSNPFFFNLWKQYERPDTITDLTFASTYYSCYKDGESCGMQRLAPWYYTTATMVDLSKATITVVNDPSFDSLDDGSFYSVTGNERTWVSNGTSNATFYFSPPSNYTDACIPNNTHFWWNSSTPFSYVLNFTNATAKMRLTLEAPEADVTFLFTGKRQDANSDASVGQNMTRGPENFHGQYSSIGLAEPANHSVPTFTFANGSFFLWQHDSQHRWYATSGAGPYPGKPGWITFVAYVGVTTWLFGL